MKRRLGLMSNKPAVVNIGEAITAPVGIAIPTVRTPSNIIKGKVAVRCLVLYRNEHGGKQEQYIYDAPMGITWKYKGKPCRVLYENPATQKLETYTPFGKEIGMMPSKLSRCRQCLPAQALLSTVSGMLEKLAFGAILVAIGIGSVLIVAIMGELGKKV